MLRKGVIFEMRERQAREREAVKESKIDEESEQELMDFLDSMTFVDKKGNVDPPELPPDESDDPENDRGEE